MTIPEPLAALHDVEVAVHGRRILGPVSIRVSPGERWVLLGPNGGGKTTLLSVLGARRQPSKGQARVLGTTFGRGDIRSIRRGIGHASHALSERFPPGIEVMDVVLTGTRAALSPWLQEYGPDDRDAARVNLDAVGCAALAGREFSTCSQGERQRVLLARALVGEPALLLLDEPSAGLDLPAREALISALDATVRDRPGLGIVLATHHLEEIPPSASHAALLRQGCFVASGPIEEVLDAGNLERCFGLGIEVLRRGGRWFGVARASREPD